MYQDYVLVALTPRAGGLTADQAAAKASQNSPALAMKRAELALTKARSSRTMARYLPKLDLTAGWTRTNRSDYDFGGGGFTVGALNEGPLTVGTCPDGNPGCVLDAAGEQVGAVSFGAFDTPVNNYRLDATLIIPFSDYALSLGLARRAIESDEASVTVQADAERARVETDARVAYYEWLRTVAQVAVAEQAVIGADARLGDARLGLQGGVLAPADVLQVESVLASTRVAVSNAKSFERLARHNLAVMMGEPENIAFQIGENVLTHTGAPAAPESLALLIAHGKAERDEIRALARAEEATELGIKSASVGLYPRLDGVVNVTHANPNPQFFPPEAAWNTSWYIGLTASWGLDRYFDTRAQIKELRANVLMLDAQRATIERAIELEITAAWQQWRRAQATLDLSRQELDAAEAAHAQRVILFRGGEATVTDILETEMQRHNATLRNIGAHVDVHVASAKLRRAAALTDGQPTGQPTGQPLEPKP